MNEKLTQQATLVFPRTYDNKILLAMKKRGFGVGKWNGMGGKVKPGEGIEAAAVRETLEEVVIDVATSSLIRIARLEFYFPGGKEESNQEVHVFETGAWSGTPQETEEMRPEFFDINELPYEDMWSDDEIWIPDALIGNYFVEAAFIFDDENNVSDIEFYSKAK